VSDEPGGIDSDLIESVAEHWQRPSKPGEQVELQLTEFISMRDKQRCREEGERREEEQYQALTRANTQRRREENARAWKDYHRAAAESLRSTVTQMIAHHEQRAQWYERHLAG
jgi:hypothetical protein